MKLAHIKGGKVIRTYHGTGRVTFENGDTVSPPTAGVHGIERLVPVVDVTVDNSKTTRTKSATVETVEADRVLRTVTVSDMDIKDIRAKKSISKGDFCKQLINFEVLSSYDGISASKGNWPNAMDEFLEYMSDDQKVSAQIEWSTAQSVERMHWLVLFMISMDVMTETAVDALFTDEMQFNAN